MTSSVELINRAIALHQQGNVGGAEAIYKKVLRVHPRNFDALHMLGIINAQRGAFQEAEKLLRKALSIDSRVAPCLHNYGTVLAKLERFEDAVNSYNNAIQLAPNHAPIYSDRGNALFKLMRYDEALTAYDRALALKPNFSDAWVGRGNVFFTLKRYDEALAAYDKALALKPDLANAWLGRGNVFNDLKRYDEAFAAYDKVLSLEPNSKNVEGARLHAKMQICDWNNFDTECLHLISSVRDGKGNTQPFAILAIASTSNDQLRCAQHIANDFFLSGKPIWQGERYNHKRLRVAYILLDVRLITELFEQHDRSRFEIIGVSLGVSGSSEARKRLVAAFDEFHDVERTSDKEAAKLLYDRQVDIAVDLKGYTFDHRFGIFACRPAPIQVNYLGYPSTMGTRFIDYIIADRLVAPFEQQQFFTEKIVHLPDCYQVNDSKRKIAEGTPTRQAAGLPEHGFVFCCFNNNYKITPRIFDCWMRILRQVEDSVLWLLEDNATAKNNLRKEAVTRGINSDRLIFAKRMPLAEHLARHRLADLFLDTLPFNAHTTASDALWVGLPVLTCLGETFAGRVAASLLNAIRLPELITTTLETYENMAIDLARHPEKLAIIKSKLAGNRLTTPLFDIKLFTKHIEAAYTEMYERHKAGLAPDHIVIPKS
jgi:protein O-GlcNAc transferase